MSPRLRVPPSPGPPVSPSPKSPPTSLPWGLRYPVEFILELLSAGMSIKDILADDEDLEKDDILAPLVLATRLTPVKSIYKIAP